MSKYHDDSTSASLPGELSLSVAKLQELEPELLTDRTFKCGPICGADHPAAEMRERYAEHLKLGCCGAALVVSASPLVIAAYASDLDGVVLLKFPPSFGKRYGLSTGTRLLAVSTFGDVRTKDGTTPLYAVDVIPGPDRTHWSNFEPFIAEFLSDDAALIEQRKRQIPEEEWKAAARTAEVRIESMGIENARDGKPSAAGTPVGMRGRGLFAPIGEIGLPDLAPPTPGEGRSWVKSAVIVLVAAAAYILLRLLRH